MKQKQKSIIHFTKQMIVGDRILQREECTKWDATDDGVQQCFNTKTGEASAAYLVHFLTAKNSPSDDDICLIMRKFFDLLKTISVLEFE